MIGFLTFNSIADALIENKLTQLKILKVKKTLLIADDFLIFGKLLKLVPSL